MHANITSPDADEDFVKLKSKENKQKITFYYSVNFIEVSNPDEGIFKFKILKIIKNA